VLRDRDIRMALERYRQKRDFRVTPEPPGKVKPGRSGELRFVIQKHRATRLHYDLRLELDGVFLSWAVPKGPSLDPNDKRLAMQVEDHPLEYGDFEGVIPPKQYGAGTVMVWDRGTWTPKTDPGKGYASGKLKFDLNGEKLKGGWNLVRSRGGKFGDKGWLLIKEADEHARLGHDAQITEERSDSAISGRSIETIASDADRVWNSNQSVAANLKAGALRVSASPKRGLPFARIAGARKAALPDRVEAQLAISANSPPIGPGWVHEIKYDGYRMLCRIARGKVHMLSRTGKDWTRDFPGIVASLAELPVESAWLDGEVVAFDESGRASFQRLQQALAAGRTGALTYVGFDLLYVNGYDLRGATLLERKRVLQDLLSRGPAAIRFSEHFEASGRDFLRNIGELGLEGMVSKRSNARYQEGRGPAWQKVKCFHRQEMVIGGFTDPEGSRTGFGALLLGVHESDGKLVYSGKVGTGFDEATLASLSSRLKRLEQNKPPFRNPPQGAEARRAHWVKPVLVAEVSFTEWTDHGTLRQPSFEGLREDKPAKDVVRESLLSAASLPAGSARGKPGEANTGNGPARNKVAGTTLTHPDKLLYPERKLTKRGLADYYATVGEWMLPHLRDRPLTLVRCPNGWDKPCFYQKNVDDSASAAISRVEIVDDDGHKSLYMMANSITAIVALVQMGVLEIHPWGSRAPRMALPDRIVFDLDPEETVPWREIRQAVLLVQTLLEKIGLAAFLKTTGGKGLHVVVPIRPSASWDDVKGFSKAVAELLERTFPDRFTAKLLKVSRHGRIFIDYLRNAEGATAVAAYSTRARAQAPVSTPIEWDELSRDVRFAHFNTTTVLRRLAKARVDPWAGIDGRAVALDAALMAKVGYNRS
jgi:bifunctional non-homologous end joining protein LigD